MPEDTLSTTPLAFGNGYLQSVMNWQMVVGKAWCWRNASSSK